MPPYWILSHSLPFDRPTAGLKCTCFFRRAVVTAPLKTTHRSIDLMIVRTFSPFGSIRYHGVILLLVLQTNLSFLFSEYNDGTLCPDRHPWCEYFARAVPALPGAKEFQKWFWKHSFLNEEDQKKPGQSYFSDEYNDLQLIGIARTLLEDLIECIPIETVVDGKKYTDFGERRWKIKENPDVFQFYDHLVARTDDYGKILGWQRVWDLVILLHVPKCGYFFRGKAVFFQDTLKLVVRNNQWVSCHPFGNGVNPSKTKRNPNTPQVVDPLYVVARDKDTGPDGFGHEYYALKTTGVTKTVLPPLETPEEEKQGQNKAARNVSLPVGSKHQQQLQYPGGPTPGGASNTQAGEAANVVKSNYTWKAKPEFYVPNWAVRPSTDVAIGYNGVAYSPVSHLLLPKREPSGTGARATPYVQAHVDPRSHRKVHFAATNYNEYLRSKATATICTGHVSSPNAAAGSTTAATTAAATAAAGTTAAATAAAATPTVPTGGDRSRSKFNFTNREPDSVPGTPNLGAGGDARGGGSPNASRDGKGGKARKDGHANRK